MAGIHSGFIPENCEQKEDSQTGILERECANQIESVPETSFECLTKCVAAIAYTTGMLCVSSSGRTNLGTVNSDTKRLTASSVPPVCC